MFSRSFLIANIAIGYILIAISPYPSAFAYTTYKRCLIKNGVTTLNCDPADGYFFEKTNDLYKKCPVTSGGLKKPCKAEDGYGLFYKNNLWYQCPIQQGKKLDLCTLANGYQVIKVY